jgi:hypothetical protein
MNSSPSLSPVPNLRSSHGIRRIRLRQRAVNGRAELTAHGKGRAWARMDWHGKSQFRVRLDLLDESERARFGELGIFPEDADIPIGVIERLWAETGGLIEFKTDC